MAERNVNLLLELRHVSKEVGSLTEARRLPVEVRRWWIDQMNKDSAARKEAYDQASGTKTVPVK